MKNLILFFTLFTLSSCSVLYAPKSSPNDPDLCKKACGLGKDSCVTECSKTPTAKECLTACDAGFNSCSPACEETETDVVLELEKLKSKIIPK